VQADDTRIPVVVTVESSENPALHGTEITLTWTVTPIPDGGGIYGMGDVITVDPQTGLATRTLRTYWPGFTYSGFYMGTFAYGDAPWEYTQVAYRLVTNAAAAVPSPSIGRADPSLVTVTLDPVPDGGRVRITDGHIVTYSDGWLDVEPDGVMDVPIRGLWPGEYDLVAEYSGTDTWEAATTTVHLHVDDRPTTTTVTTSPNPSPWGEEVQIAVRVEPIPDVHGSIAVYVDGVGPLAWPEIDWTTGTGMAALRMTGGTHTVRAEYMPGYWSWDQPSRWGASEASVEHVVLPSTEDTTPPVVTMSINDGAAVAADSSVDLSFEFQTDGYLSDMVLSGDGIHWLHTSPRPLVGWQLNDANYGPIGDGVRTVYVKVADDHDNWSEVASDSIVLDTTAPVGTVTVEGGAPFAASREVVIDLPAEDAIVDVAGAQLSNDGNRWTTIPYAPSAAWRLTAGDGRKTVRVRWKDSLGHWSASRADTIVLDTTAPTVFAPKVRPVAVEPSGDVILAVPMRGRDAGSGITAFDLRRRVDGGAWVYVSDRLGTASARVRARRGTGVELSVRASDGAGNRSSWQRSGSLRPSIVGDGSPRIRYRGAWRTTTGASHLGNTVHRSRDPGSTASITFIGRAIGLVSAVGPDRGRAAIFVDGRRVATVDLRAATAGYARIVWARSWKTPALHTVTIRVLGTPGRPRVDVDGFVLVR
jgi:hypothetical protein